jgi:hypothetical protein
MISSAASLAESPLDCRFDRSRTSVFRQEEVQGSAQLRIVGWSAVLQLPNGDGLRDDERLAEVAHYFTELVKSSWRSFGFPVAIGAPTRKQELCRKGARSLLNHFWHAAVEDVDRTQRVLSVNEQVAQLMGQRDSEDAVASGVNRRSITRTGLVEKDAWTMPESPDG